MRIAAILFLACFSVAVFGQQQNGFCYTMQVALASGVVGFQPFRGVMDKDTLHYKVKEELFENSSFKDGSMVLENAGERKSKYDGQSFRLNYMEFNTVVIGYKNGGIADTVIDESTYKKFTDYVQSLAAQCYAEYKLIEGPRNPRSGNFGTWFIAPAEVALDGDYLDFAKMIDKPFIALKLDGFWSKGVHISITFYYPTAK